MNPKKPKIKAVIFDMNGVLALDIELKHGTSISKSFHDTMAKKLGISLDTWIDAIDTVYSDSIEGKISEKKVLKTISSNLNISPYRLEKEIIRTYRKLFKENKELYSYAFQLKKRGYKIAILSDQWPFSKKAIYKNSNIRKFDAVITSSDVGLRKPDPKIYELTLKKLHLRPPETIFVDNRDWNLKPARKLGVEAVLFKNNKQTIKKIESFLSNEA